MENTKSKIFLSVVISCYNEEENLKRGVLKEMYDFLSKKDFSWEVIVSDDGSTDGSVEIAKSQIKNLGNFKLLENPHGGKPSGLNYGIKASKGEYILFTDMDQSTPIEEVDKLLPGMKDDSVGAVIGSRGLTREDFPLYRKLGAIMFSIIRRGLILPEIIDTQCGFKLFRRAVLTKYFEKLDFFKNSETVTGWKVTSWDVEFLYLIKKKGFKIIEVKVKWMDRDTSISKGGTLTKYVKESREMFGQILKVKLNDWKGAYES